MIIHGDMLEEVGKIADQSVDVIIFDPPYGIGNQPLELKNRKWKKTDVDWDQFSSIDKQYDFYYKCLSLLCAKLRDSGSIFVFGSFHNIYLIGEILQHHVSMHIVNSIVWNKQNAMFNITKSSLIEGTEHIIWACRQKGSLYFDYDYTYSIGDKQLRNVWTSSITPTSERINHPHQKPTWLIDRILRMACPPNGLVLDPMSGSGTTAVVAQHLGLQYICIEKNESYYLASKNRLHAEKDIDALAIRRIGGIQKIQDKS